MQNNGYLNQNQLNVNGVARNIQSSRTTPHSSDNRMVSIFKNFTDGVSPHKSDKNHHNLFETNRNERSSLIFNNDGIHSYYKQYRRAK